MNMLVICTLVTLAAVVNADNYFVQRQQASPPTPPQGPAPYAPSGWKPAGTQFQLPTKSPKPYRPSGQTYGVPTKVSSTTTTTEATEPTTDPIDITTYKPQSESENLSEFSEASTSDSGTYYVLLPDGKLQKVTYTTMPLEESSLKLQQAVSNAQQHTAKQTGFVANVKYQDVEPINGPIYSYNTAPLVRIF